MTAFWNVEVFKTDACSYDSHKDCAKYAREITEVTVEDDRELYIGVSGFETLVANIEYSVASGYHEYIVTSCDESSEDDERVLGFGRSVSYKDAVKRCKKIMWRVIGREKEARRISK